jgi:hypothetical protein
LRQITAARERAKELRRMIDEGEDPLSKKEDLREAHRVTASGKYTLFPDIGADGSETAAALLLYARPGRLGRGRSTGRCPGDRIEIDGEAFLIQGEPVRDRERLVWTVDLRPAN